MLSIGIGGEIESLAGIVDFANLNYAIADALMVEGYAEGCKDPSGIPKSHDVKSDRFMIKDSM